MRCDTVFQEDIASVVTMQIIDGLESVQVDERDCDELAAASALEQGLLHAVGRVRLGRPVSGSKWAS